MSSTVTTPCTGSMIDHARGGEEPGSARRRGEGEARAIDHAGGLAAASRTREAVTSTEPVRGTRVAQPASRGGTGGGADAQRSARWVGSLQPQVTQPATA